MNLAAELLRRVRAIWEVARLRAACSVNTTHVCAHWLIGQQIVEEEQDGADRAVYGVRLPETLSAPLSSEYGMGFSVPVLRYMRLFYLGYPDLRPIHHAVRDELGRAAAEATTSSRHAPRDESGAAESLGELPLSHTLHSILASDPGSNWKPGRLHSGLSWTH